MIKQSDKNIGVATVMEFNVHLTQYHILMPSLKNFEVFREIISHFFPVIFVIAFP